MTHAAAILTPEPSRSRGWEATHSPSVRARTVAWLPEDQEELSEVCRDVLSFSLPGSQDGPRCTSPTAEPLPVFSHFINSLNNFLFLFSPCTGPGDKQAYDDGQTFCGPVWPRSPATVTSVARLERPTAWLPLQRSSGQVCALDRCAHWTGVLSLLSQGTATATLLGGL